VHEGEIEKGSSMKDNFNFYERQKIPFLKYFLKVSSWSTPVQGLVARMVV